MNNRLEIISASIYLLVSIKISLFFFKDIDLGLSNLTKGDYTNISLILWNILDH